MPKLVEDDPAARWLSTRPINPCPDTDKTYELARSWLSRCLSTHQHSLDMPQEDGGPLRLLKIDKDHDQYKLGLISMAETQQQPPYIALSYCWGGEQMYKTTKEILPTYLESIDYTTLPKTIQDAIKVTWGIGHAYMWVDSLCITQDDDAEMATEISRMPLIYSNAVCTSSASSARGASYGFLQPRHRYHTFRFNIQRSGGEEEEEETIYALEPLPDFGNEPLENRGWNLQEGLLSKRILYFGSRQLRWYCACKGKHEASVDGWMKYPEMPTVEYLKTFENTWNGGQKSSRLALPGDHPYSSWTIIIENYTQRKLTVPSDRILAISGVAHALYKHLDHNDMYIAGHWLSTLPGSLLWRVNFGRAIGFDHDTEAEPWKDSRPAGYIGPSWSWVSNTHKIKFQYFHSTLDPSWTSSQHWEPALRICSIDLELEHTSAKYGAVKKAVLTMRGRVKKAICKNNPSPARSQPWRTKILEVPVGTKIFAETVGLDYPLADFGTSDDNDSTEWIYLLEVGRTTSLSKDSSVKPTDLYMLALREVHLENSVRRFMRLGFVQRALDIGVAKGAPQSSKCDDLFWDSEALTFELE